MRRFKRARGFTLIEMMVVVGVIAILAMLALPSIQTKIISDQIIEAAKLADLAKAPLAAAWTVTHTLPADNAAAGLPAADRIVSNLVGSVAIEAGAIQVTFANRASAAINGKTLSLRAAVVEDAPIVPVAWICGNAPVPARMTVHGPNRTNIADALLPLNCRSG